MGWATIWVIFSQTHLVTLAKRKLFCRREHWLKTVFWWSGLVVSSYRVASKSGLPDFSWYNIPTKT
jgi:hypothetical protein